MLRFIQEFTASRLSWGLLIIFGMAMEGCALYFQYGLNLDPCVNCVYERACMAGFVIAGLLGFLFPSFKLTRLLSSLIFLGCSGLGLKISIGHYIESVSTGFGSSCAIKASFPSFMPLDEWLPWLFKPIGQCGKLPWSLLGLGMPEWLIIIFSCGIAVSVAFLLSQFASRKRDFTALYR
ncbi:MAG: disulfide bond formation protein DsbB [Succinivibrio sp.]|nr:disulfide bond formation protein DsbB [Succinivibrio sp.]